MDPDEITPPQFKKDNEAESRDAAVNVIRTKLDALYKDEPSAQEEAKEVAELDQKSLSKHQRYMKELSESEKDTAEVQTAWHDYYQNLSEEEKHKVWQEFYSQQARLKQQKKEEAERQIQQAKQQIILPKAKPPVKRRPKKSTPPLPSRRISESTARVKALKNNHHVRSLLFGLSMGFTVIGVLLFSFFNERFITPFIRPSQNVSATPIIVDPNSTAPVGPESLIIIPKINIEAPVVYDVASIEEKAVQEGLERGVVHYGTTPNPGEAGNAVIFGHSSGNILNKGKYKFAFLLLKSLEKDDTFIIQKDGKRYVYKVYNKFVTLPTDISVLNPSDKPAIITLITCDPPGTSTNRLILQAEQIFPDPSANTKSTAPEGSNVQPEQLPSNSRSLWQRIIGD